MRKLGIIYWFSGRIPTHENEMGQAETSIICNWFIRLEFQPQLPGEEKHFCKCCLASSSDFQDGSGVVIKVLIVVSICQLITSDSLTSNEIQCVAEWLTELSLFISCLYCLDWEKRLKSGCVWLGQKAQFIMFVRTLCPPLSRGARQDIKWADHNEGNVTLSRRSSLQNSGGMIAPATYYYATSIEKGFK